MTSLSHRNDTDDYEVIPATIDDAEAIYDCNRRAFEESYLISQIYPEDRADLTSAEEFKEFRIEGRKKILQRDTTLCLKVVSRSEPEVVVGYSTWFKPNHFSFGTTLSQSHGHAAIQDNGEVDTKTDAAPEGNQESSSGKETQSNDFPACVNVEVQKEFLAKMDEYREKIWGDDANFWYIAGLAVDPTHRRKGLATRLLREGLDRADADSLPCYVEASPDGSKIYPSLGFERVAQYEFFDGKHVIEFHIRPAQSG